MTRLVHLSDVHVSAPNLEWRFHDWFNKRLAAWANYRFLGRGKRFQHGERVLAAFRRNLEQRPPDHVIFSGDATALGFESEIRKAAELLEVGRRPGLAVPGNHDYCTRPAERSGLFEKYFDPWQTGQRIDDARYPFAQRVGTVWLVALNSCTGNFWFWDAAGSVGTAQIERLRRLLDSLDDRPKILVTHYPVCLDNRKPEPFTRGLRDLANVVAVVNGQVALWLHGHRHHHYHVPDPPQAKFPIICAGSGTQTGRWSYFEYTIEGGRLHALRRTYDFESDSFRDAENFEVALGD